MAATTTASLLVALLAVVLLCEWVPSQVVYVSGYPVFARHNYSATLQTRDYASDYYTCTIDTHDEFIQTPNYGISVYPPGDGGEAELDRYDIGYSYAYPWILRNDCQRSYIYDYSGRYAFLGDWLNSKSVLKGTTTIVSDYYFGVPVEIWSSDPSWEDALYTLYVTPSGIPIRETACVIPDPDDDDYTYAYVTDFNNYNPTQPSFDTYFKVPSSCPGYPVGSSSHSNNIMSTQQPTNNIVDVNKKQAPSSYRHERRNRRVARALSSKTATMSNGAAAGGGSSSFQPQAQCYEFSFVNLCAELKARVAASKNDDSSSGSATTTSGFKAGIAVAAVAVLVLWAFVRRGYRCECQQPDIEETYEMDVVPWGTKFQYVSDGKEEKRPEGSQLQREGLAPRENVIEKLNLIDFTFSSHDNGKVYWDESGAYRLTSFAARELENATRELHGRCMDVVARVISSDDLMTRLGISPELFRSIRKSWDSKEPSIYGRFDFIYDGLSPPKMLEYNADTPTVIIESGIAQRTWLTEMQSSGRLLSTFGQFNELEESLINHWRDILNEAKQKQAASNAPIVTGAAVTSINVAPLVAPILHMVCVRGHEEDAKNMAAMAGYARAAGFDVRPMFIDEMKWDDSRSTFVDAANIPISLCWKLYPFEWMASDSLNHLASGTTQWVEPPWKMIMSSKGILPLLWEMFPNHPNLLPSSWNEADARQWNTRYVSKPLQGREGQMVTIKEPNGSPIYSRGLNSPTSAGGPSFMGEDGEMHFPNGVGATMIYQQYVEPPSMYAVVPPAGPPKPGYIPPKEAPPVPTPTVVAPSSYVAYSSVPQPQPMVASDMYAMSQPPPPAYSEKEPPSFEAATNTFVTTAAPFTQPPGGGAVTFTPTVNIQIQPMVVTTLTGEGKSPAVAPVVAGGMMMPMVPAGMSVVRPVFGSWVVGGQPSGIVIREDSVLVTNNESRIVPHYIVDGPFRTSPQMHDAPTDERDEEPGADTGTTSTYTGYRLGFTYRRSTYWYRMSPSQAYYYRLHRGPGHLPLTLVAGGGGARIGIGGGGWHGGRVGARFHHRAHHHGGRRGFGGFGHGRRGAGS